MKSNSYELYSALCISLKRVQLFRKRLSHNSVNDADWYGLWEIDQFRYIKIQSNTIDFRTRLWALNSTDSVVIPAQEPRSEVYYFRLNFNISKLVYWRYLRMVEVYEVQLEGKRRHEYTYLCCFLLYHRNTLNQATAKLPLPIITFDIVAFAFTLLWEHLSRNSCLLAFKLRSYLSCFRFEFRPISTLNAEFWRQNFCWRGQ